MQGKRPEFSEIHDLGHDIEKGNSSDQDKTPLFLLGCLFFLFLFFKLDAER